MLGAWDFPFTFRKPAPNLLFKATIDFKLSKAYKKDWTKFRLSVNFTTNKEKEVRTGLSKSFKKSIRRRCYE